MKSFEKGNIAIGKAGIAAGCRFYAGYPITPQNDVPEYLSDALPKVGGIFIQGSSEVESGNILMGAGLGGARAMSSTSGPGFGLFSEPMAFMAGMEVPAVIVDVARPGPAMGGIDAAQEDYMYAVKAPGNGGSRCFVTSPCSVQELVDQVYGAFDLAEKYRVPVIVLTDAIVGQTWEVIELPEAKKPEDIPCSHDWDVTWRKSNKLEDQNYATSIMNPISNQELLAKKLAAKYEAMQEDCKWEEFMMDDAEIVIFAYGSVGRICKAAVKALRQEGIKVGMFRPITLFPFPTEQIRNLDYSRITKAIDIEMAAYGMMKEDVDIAVNGQINVEFYGRGGGTVITPDQIIAQVKAISGRS